MTGGLVSLGAVGGERSEVRHAGEPFEVRLRRLGECKCRRRHALRGTAGRHADFGTGTAFAGTVAGDAGRRVESQWEAVLNGRRVAGGDGGVALQSCVVRRVCVCGPRVRGTGVPGRRGG